MIQFDSFLFIIIHNIIRFILLILTYETRKNINMNKELRRENFSDALMAFKVEVYKALKIEVVVKVIERVIKKR